MQQPQALDFSVEAVDLLVEHLDDDSRTLPVIVFSEPRVIDDRWSRRADQVATRVAGIARVVRIPASAAQVMRDRLGTLAVWGGAVRTYLPGPIREGTEGWRHRHFSHQRLVTDGPGVIDRLVFAAAQLSARRRVPEVFRPLLEQGADSATIRALEKDRDGLDLELCITQEELESVSKELAHANGHLERLRVALAEENREHVFWGTKTEPTGDEDALPDEVQDTTSAVMLAQEHLSEWVSLPDDAVRELDGIDSAPTAGTWGNATWRGLRALAAYTRARRDGRASNFWDWCANSGDPFVWPATSKKLSMKESESVQNNRKYRDARNFPIEIAVDPTGKIYMDAHLKIAEGGGNLAPRVYFYDDTEGSTKKVHIGFIGPHHLVPNTKS